MIKFFEYNWQIRNEWFEWCKQLPEEEVLKMRPGEVGNILKTLFHIVEVEYSWVRGIQGKEDIVLQLHDYPTLDKVKKLSNQLCIEVVEFLNNNYENDKCKTIRVSWDDESYIVEDILRHIITHEIHHIGQLSIWARELELSPVPSYFIGRELKSIHSYGELVIMDLFIF